MTFAARKTVANELFVQLEHLFDENAAPDKFTLAKLEREAIALQKVNASDASMVRAGISALSWDFANAQRWVKNSLSLDGSVDNLLNAALTYRQLNRLDLTAEIALKAYNLAPNNVSAVNATIEGLWMSGQFKKAAAMYRRALQDGITIDDGGKIPDHYADYLTELEIPPDRATFEVQSAQQVLAKNCKRVQVLNLELYVDHDELASLVIQIGFFGNIDDELRLESELAQVLADKPGWNPSLLTTELQYLVPHVHEHA